MKWLVLAVEVAGIWTALSILTAALWALLRRHDTIRIEDRR